MITIGGSTIKLFLAIAIAVVISWFISRAIIALIQRMGIVREGSNPMILQWILTIAITGIIFWLLSWVRIIIL